MLTWARENLKLLDVVAVAVGAGVLFSFFGEDEPRLSDFLLLGGFVIAYLNSRRQNRVQDLQEQQIRRDLQAGEQTRVAAEIHKNGQYGGLRIRNAGTSAAFEVRLEFPKGNPFPGSEQEQIEEAFPRDRMDPGDKRDFRGYGSHQFDVRLSWTNEDGTPGEKTYEQLRFGSK